MLVSVRGAARTDSAMHRHFAKAACCIPFWLSTSAALSVLLLLLLLLPPGNRCVESGRPRRSLDRKPELRIPVPLFVTRGLATNVSASAGSTVQLPCRAQQLGNRAISWIRKKDLHVLTSGTFTYTSDSRFHVVHPERSNEWHLSISRVNESDSGVYECQINTEPKKSFSVDLLVTSLLVQVAGPSEIHVEEGSAVNLTCTVEGMRVTPQDRTSSSSSSNGGGPHLTSWLLDGRPVRASAIVTERLSGAGADADADPDPDPDPDAVVSNLLIPRARSSDSGKYVCSGTGSGATSRPVAVHVLIGENSAAMQRESSVSGGTVGLVSNVVVIVVVVVVVAIGQGPTVLLL